MTGPRLRQEAAGDEARRGRRRGPARRGEAVARRETRAGRGRPDALRTALPACAIPVPEAFCPPPAPGGPE